MGFHSRLYVANNEPESRQMVENVSLDENGGFFINICVFRHFMVFLRVGQDEQKNLIQDFLDKRNMMTLVLYLTPAGVLTADEESPPSSKTKVRIFKPPSTHPKINS